jgi:hypothetical protein
MGGSNVPIPNRRHALVKVSDFLHSLLTWECECGERRSDRREFGLLMSIEVMVAVFGFIV